MSRLDLRANSWRMRYWKRAGLREGLDVYCLEAEYGEGDFWSGA